MEIDENLKRADLGEPELGLHLKRRKELYVQKHPETTNGGDRKSVSKIRNLNDDKQPARFTLEAAKVSGKAESTVALSISRVEKLGDDNARRIIGTSLAKGVEMDALIKLAPEARADLISRAASGERV
jgi:hypothetical protein